MGVLLREVLRLLCGVNRWSYAVFWKIGCQNPKLLIWEDSYYDSSGEWEGFGGTDAQFSMPGVQTGGNGVHLLVNKMMMDNQVLIVGEGIVGRAAFTGNHDWILANNYTGLSHPPEVVNEIQSQFSAGMQTVAVIPVCPHGVVQLGSSLAITENSGFVSNVKSLILQPGCIPGAFLSDNHEEKDLTERPGIPRSFGHPRDFSEVLTPTSLLSETWKQPSFSSSQASRGLIRPQIGQCQDNPKSPAVSTIWGPNLADGVAQVIPQPPETSVNWHRAANFSSKIEFHHHHHRPSSGHSDTSNTVLPIPAQQIVLESRGPCRFGNTKSASESLANTNSDHVSVPSQETKQKMDSDLFQAMNLQSIQLNRHQRPGQSAITVDNEFTDPCAAAQPSSGDDLYDILGVDFRNKLLGGKWTNAIPDRSHEKSETSIEDSKSSDLYSSKLPASGTDDYLLEAVVSRCHSSAKQNTDDSISCITTVAKANSSSVPSEHHAYGPVSVPDPLQREPFDFPGRGRTATDDLGSCSRTTSVYESQLSSLGSHNLRLDNGASTTGVSQKNAESGNKPNRKRLKPGENPRPRPKDRQMIQDRVKELRDIVPSGTKCSIDALLERTIKHMLFLQSVTKHADELKQTEESKALRSSYVIRKDGGVLSEGGATWAFEVGSQSMVCPIIVEDLNPPRQMLVEMLCEERGLFLELADLIRGMGMTILKGVVEARSDKIWARFVVEANRDVTRMEIFMSLVHHLQQTTLSANGAESSSSNMMAQQQHGFSRAAAPIPATGGLVSLH